MVRKGNYYNRTNTCDRCREEDRETTLVKGKAYREYNDEGNWTEKWLCKSCWCKKRYIRGETNSNITKLFADFRTGNLDPDCNTTKAIKSQKLACELYGWVDLNEENDNYASPIDCHDLKTGLYHQVQIRYYNSEKGYWPFSGFTDEWGKIFEDMVCFCISEDGEIIERIYKFPWREIMKKTGATIYKNPIDRWHNPITPGWYNKYRITNKGEIKNANNMEENIREINMNKKINIAIVGAGNCASSLVQGLEYYKDVKDSDSGEHIPGLMHNSINGYLPSNIECVLAYDIDARKIGKSIEAAIFSAPNNTKVFCKDIPKSNVIVKMGQILDGFSGHLLDYDEKYRIVPSKEQEPTKEDVIRTLKESNTQILLNYCPVGSVRATEFYTECCLEAGVALINCIPVFIASEETWANKFKDKGLPILGDDIKSQFGSTIVNRILVQMIQDRGGKIVNSWQTNFGGNTDFLNMVSQDRLESKKISKTESISSLISDKNNYIYAGPNGFIECLSDNKISFMRIDFKIFGDIPCSIDLKLSVEDSPNSGGVVIDAIRIAKICLDKGIGGPILPACAWMFKRPPQQMKDEDARKQLEDFINS